MNVKDFHRTCPKAKLVSRSAALGGYKLSFNGFSHSRGGGIANIMPSKKGRVVGVIWDVPESEMANLDRREGAPFFYERRYFYILHKGQRSEVVTYVLVKPQKVEYAPTDEYANIILSSIKDEKYRIKVEEHIHSLWIKEWERMNEYEQHFGTDCGRFSDEWMDRELLDRASGW